MQSSPFEQLNNSLNERIFTNCILLLFLAAWWGVWLPILKIFLILLILVFLIDCTNLLKRYDKYIQWLKLIGLFAFGAGLRLGGIRASPPDLDVYLISEEAVENILRGINPYGVTYQWGRLVYPPFTLLLYTPAKIFTLDLRYTLLILDILTAILLFCYFRRSESFSFIITGYFLLNFYFRSMITGLYGEVALSLFLLASFITFEVNPKGILSPIIAGLSLAVKQFAIYFVPFLFFKYDLKKKALFLASTVIVYGPFLIPDSKPLIESFLWPIHTRSFHIRADTTSFFRILFWIYGGEVPAPLVYVFILLQFGIPALMMLILIPKINSPKQLAFFSIIVYFLALAVSPYSMINYFYPALALIPYAILPREPWPNFQWRNLKWVAKT